MSGKTASLQISEGEQLENTASAVIAQLATAFFVFRLKTTAWERTNWGTALVPFDVHLFACQGNYAPYITYSGGCQAIFYQYQETAMLLQGMGQYGFLSDPRAEAELQRGNMLISARCASGALDGGSCSAYLGCW